MMDKFKRPKDIEIKLTANYTKSYIVFRSLVKSVVINQRKIIVKQKKTDLLVFKFIIIHNL